MKLTITTENLLFALRRVMSVIGNNLANPIMNNFLLEAIDNKLLVTGVDNEIRTTTEVAALVFAPGKITLPGKKFYQIVAALPGLAGSFPAIQIFHGIRCAFQPCEAAFE